MVPRFVGLAAATVAACAGLGLGLGPGPGPSDALASGPAAVCSGARCTVTFEETGSTQTWTVPDGVSSATFTVDGAAGGAVDELNGSTTAAGAGGQVLATLALSGGQVLTLGVGGQGDSAGSDGGDGLGGYDGGGDDLNGGYGGGGGGGGYSDVSIAGTIELLAGGGGGAGGVGNSPSTTPAGGAGGSGGNSGAIDGDGGAGVSGSGYSSGGGGGGRGGANDGGGGAGGTQTGNDGCPAQAGAGGFNGEHLVGGDGDESGPKDAGGGGGGYTGGGGGGSGGDAGCSYGASGGGGGGGSSYAASGISATYTTGAETGDGQIVISYADPVTASRLDYAAAYESTLSEPASQGLIDSNSEPSGDTLTATAASQPAHGSLTVDSDGAFTYKPDAGYYGPDSFTYTLTDAEGDSATGTVALTVNRTAPSAPGKPKAVAGAAGSDQASISFTPPSDDGGAMVTGYTVTASPGGKTASGVKSPITVTGLTPGKAYTFTVAARNAVGAGSASVASNAVTIPTPPGCPEATGSASAKGIGLVRLGMTRARARKAYTHSSDRGKAYQDFFCLTPAGIRVGYGSPKLPRSQRARYRNHVIWISTSNTRYAIDTVRAGTTLKAAKAHLRGGRTFYVGRNDWYLARFKGATAVLKVRHNTVEEIGIGVRALTRTARADRSFLRSFE